MIGLLAFISTLLFMITAVMYSYHFFRSERGEVFAPARVMLIVSIIAAIVYTVNLSYAFGKFPLSSLSEAFDFIALMLAVAYLLIEITTRNANTGFLIMIIVVLFKLIALAFVKHSSEVNPILSSGYFIVHVIPSALGYTAFTLSMIYACLYLVLHKELHQKKFGPFYKKLPPLGAMNRMIRHSVKLGFALLTLGILTGMFLSKHTFSVYLKSDPKIVMVLIVWSAYLLFLVLARVFSLKGKGYAISSIVGFVIVFLALVFVEIFMRSFHSFV